MGGISNTSHNFFSLKRVKSKLLLIFFIFVLLTVIVVSAINEGLDDNQALSLENETEIISEQQSNLEILEDSLIDASLTELEVEELIEAKEPILAEIIGGKSIFSEDASNYLNLMNYFDDLAFENVGSQETFDVHMNVGDMEPAINGFLINDKKYVIHLILCYKEIKSCAFRINGVTTGWISAEGVDENRAKKEFKVDNSISIKINSINFDYCGNQRFCDYYSEAYDVVDISLNIHTTENNQKIEKSSLGMIF